MKIKYPGFSLVEALLAGAIFSLLISSLVGAYIYGQDTGATAGRMARAVFLAEEGLEAARNIRDYSFTQLFDGQHGLSVSSTGWVFSGTSDIKDIYNRSVVVTTLDPERKQATVNISWPENLQRQGFLSLTTYLTDWQVITQAPISTCSAYCVSLMYSLGTCRNSPANCQAIGGVYESGGDIYCTVGAADSCCCMLP